MSATDSGNYASGPLPEALTIPGWRVALIIASFTFSLPGFLNNAQAGLALGLNQAVLAALLAGLILCAGACLTAIVSVRTRLTTYMLVQRSFGIWGAAAGAMSRSGAAPSALTHTAIRITPTNGTATIARRSSVRKPQMVDSVIRMLPAITNNWKFPGTP